MNTITISKTNIKKAGGIVILPLKEYERLSQMAVPTYYLKGKAAVELDKLVEGGLDEHRNGETIHASSLQEALKLYGQKKGKKN